MRPFGSVISLEEARRRVEAAAVPIERTERVHLAEAAGRVAAETISSPLDVPPFARSAMDGYALRAADTTGADGSHPVQLRVVDRIYTAHVPHIAVSPNTCAQIATGAPIPDGADAVVMVEETAPAGNDEIQILAAVAAGQNIGRQGADIREGDAVVRAGDWLAPSRVGALAAIGCEALDVYARPRVATLSTGNEVVEPGRPLEPGQIFDVNRFTLAAVVEGHGAEAVPHAPVGDTVEALVDALDACAGADVVVFSGGSSVGDRDLIVDAVAARGEMIFHGIAVKPGKPTAFARVRRPGGGTTLFFGMPGNPTSCLSNAYILLVPLVRALAHLPPWTPRTVRVPLGRRVTSVANRHQFYTVKLENGVAQPAFKGSGEITSLSRADGYIEIAEGETAVDAGTIVEVTLF
jgi:molybdopterin molybdotransferase